MTVHDAYRVIYSWRQLRCSTLGCISLSGYSIIYHLLSLNSPWDQYLFSMISVYVYTCVCIHVCVYTCVCVHVCVCTCVCVHMCA